MAYGAKGQIPTAQEAAGRDTNSIVQGLIDRGPWQYWDTIYFANATAVPASIEPFSVPNGQLNTLGASGGATLNVAKTKLQTNMALSKQFPPPRCLLLISIGFWFSGEWVKSDIDKIMQATYFEFRIDDKIFHEGWLHDAPPGSGFTGVSNVAGESVYTNGLPAPQYSRRFGDWAKYIAPQQLFSLKLTFGGGGITAPTIGTGSTAINYPGVIRVTLDGLTDRSVQ